MAAVTLPRPKFGLYLFHPRYWLVWLAYGLLWLLTRLPFRWQMRIGRKLGWILFHTMTTRRAITRRNIQACFPELTADQQEQLCRDNFAEAGISLMETGIAWWWPKRRIMSLMDMEGQQHVQAAQQTGKGIMLLSMHFMSLEIGARMFSTMYPSYGFYRRNRNPVLEYLQFHGRTAGQAELIGRDNIRAALRVLKNGSILWYAPDQDLGRRRSIFAPFFGIETATVPATGVLAGRGNALVLPFYQYRKPDDSGYKMVVGEPLQDFPKGDERADTAHVNAIIEDIIRKHPQSYMWMHRRFKTRPNEDDAPFYDV